MGDTRLEGDVEAIRDDHDSEFACRVLRMYDAHSIRRESTNAIGVPQRNGNVERVLGIFYSMQMAVREQARVSFPNADIPKPVR